MGYTHYWKIARTPTPRAWSRFANEVDKILAHDRIRNLVCYEEDEPDRPALLGKDLLRFNGKGDDGHETFLIEAKAEDFNFCKTARKPYDLAVCCVLLSAAHHLKAEVSSDGDWDSEEDGWKEAATLYQEVTGREPTSPWPMKICAKCGKSFSRDGHKWGGYRKNTAGKPMPKTWCYFCSEGR